MVQYKHMLAHTRFKVSKKGILWTVLDEGFNPNIINFFAKRYPLFHIMLEFNGKTFVKKKNTPLITYNKKVKEVVEIYEKRLKDISFLEGLEDDAFKLWSEFYDSQYIKQRKNHKLFHQWVPKYLKKVKGLQKEFDSVRGCMKITKFIKQE